jgi:nicotinamidase/pyrazinamidase
MTTIFWNVDTQYDFMRDDESHKGLLPVPGARGIEGNLERMTKIAKDYDLKVVNTADFHLPTSKEISRTPDYKTTFPAHCLVGTKGADYVPATQPVDAYAIGWWEDGFDDSQVRGSRNIILYKDAFDVFAGNPHADRVVNLLDPQRVIVYGVATNVCVDQAVQGLYARGKEVYVVKDAIKELPHLSLEETLKGWVGKATLITTESVESYIR